MTRPLRTELRVAFAVLLTLLFVVGAAGTLAVGRVSANIRQVTQDLVPAQEVNAALLQALTDAETGIRGYALSADRDALAPYRTAAVRIPAQRRRLTAFASGDPETRRLVVEQDEAVSAWLKDYAVVRLEKQPGPASFDSALFATGKTRFDTIRQTNTAVDEQLQVRLGDLQAEADTIRDLVVVGIAVLTLFALLVGAVTSTIVSRRVRYPLAGLRDVLADLTSGTHDARAVATGPMEVAAIADSVNSLADETARLRSLEAEERRLQNSVLQLGRRLRESLDLDEVAQAGLSALGEGLILDRAYVRLVEDGSLAEIRNEWCTQDVEPLPEASRRLSPGPMELLRDHHAKRAPMVTVDTETSPMFASGVGKGWALATGARGTLTVPVAVNNEPIGVITCISFERRDWADGEIHFSESVADDLGRAMANARLYIDQQAVIERLRELDQAKDDFMSSVSHELRTPLTSISGYVELLEDEETGALGAQHQRLLGIVRRNVDRLRMLIEDLLTLSRIESGAFRSKLAPVELGEVVRGTVEDMRPQAVAGGVAVHVRTPSTPTVVEGDQGQLSRALLNLLSNSIKFTRSGGRVDVDLYADAETGEAVVQVRDTGIGIPAKALDSLFTRFFRAANAVTSGVPGTGLGLVIVQTIATNHGGSLAVDSHEGRGTTVSLTIPTSQVQSPSTGSATK